MRSKLGVVVAVPAVVVLVLTFLRMHAQLQEQESLTTALQGLRVGTSALRVSDALQHERDSTVAFVAGRRIDTASLNDRIGESDRAVLGLLASAGHPGLHPPVRTEAQRVLNDLAGLAALRTAATQTLYPAVAALARYTQILDGLARLNRATTSAVSNLPVGRHAEALQALADMQDHMTFQNAVLIGAASSRQLPAESADDLRAARSRFDAARTVFATGADPALRQRFQDTVTGPDIDARNRLVDTALIESGARRMIGFPVSEVARIGDAATDLVRSLRQGVEQDVSGTVERLAGEARRSLFRDQALVGAGLVGAVVVMLWMTRLLIRPLQALRRAALRVATDGLPRAIELILADPRPESAVAVDPVPVHTGEEVGQVARAFDVVHREAIRLAAEQARLRGDVAAMFTSLSRRSQALVERQIDTLDRLERDEQDPDRLAGFFELDHLATRMRRNNENLLVLAGARLNQPVTKPVPIEDVLRAAMSEIAQYARVQIEPTPGVAVRPPAVRDLVHLLAELLDNATAFSKPDTKVIVHSRLDHRRERLVLQIRDCGVGVKPAELAAINASLATPPDVDVAVSQRMGLFVVAKLAGFHGLDVRLQVDEEFDDGTTAFVALPATLLAQRPETLYADRLPPATPVVGRAATAAAEPLPIDLFDAGDTHRAPAANAAAHPTERHTAASSPQQQRPQHTTTAASRRARQTDTTHRGVTTDPPTQRFPRVESPLSMWFRTGDEDRARDTGAGQRLGLDGEPVSRALPGTTDGRPLATTVVDRPMPAVEETGMWRSTADEGWQAAKDLVGSSPGNSGATVAGLPKREPRTRLMPGSMAPTPGSSDDGAPHRTVTPDIAAGLARFQQGVRSGRHALSTPASTADSIPTVTPEEQA